MPIKFGTLVTTICRAASRRVLALPGEPLSGTFSIGYSGEYRTSRTGNLVSGQIKEIGGGIVVERCPLREFGEVLRRGRAERWSFDSRQAVDGDYSAKGTRSARLELSLPEPIEAIRIKCL